MQQALAPYIVTLWNGREPEDAPDDVQQLMRQRQRSRSQSNIHVFVLDTQGQLVHSFDAMTDLHPAPMHDLKKRMPGYFKQELSRAAAKMNFTPAIPTTKPTPHLPTASAPGIRVYVTMGENRMQHFMVPTVEAVSIDQEEQKQLRYPAEARKMEATVVKRWLATMYPPAVMDGHGGMDQVKGTLTFTPAGENATHRFATVRGTVKLQLDNVSKISYQGPLDLMLQYKKDSDEVVAVWGLFTSKVPRGDQRGKAVEYVNLTSAIEPIK